MKTQILKFSEQIRSIACNEQYLAIGFCDGTIEMQELQSGAYVLVRSWKGHRRVISGLIFLSDGGLMSGSFDRSVKRWDLGTRRAIRNKVSVSKEQWVWDLGGGVNSLAELSDGRVVAGCDDSTVRMFDLDTRYSPSQGWVCRGHTLWVTTVISLGVVGDSADSFASGSVDRTIRVWANDGTLTRVVEVGSPVYSLFLSPLTQLSCDGKVVMVAAKCGDGSVHLFHIPKWNAVWKNKSEKVHTGWMNSISFSPTGRFLVSASDDHLIKILSTETGNIFKTLKGHTDLVRSVLFSQNGFSVISGSDDSTIRVWRLVEQDDRIASLLSGRTPLDLVYQGADVFKQLFTIIRTKLIGF